MAKPILAGRGWFSISEAGRYAGVSPDVVKRAVDAGELPAYEKPATYAEHRVNRFLKVSREDVDAWVRSWPRGGDAA